MSTRLGQAVRNGSASILSSTTRRQQQCSSCLYTLLTPSARYINTTAIRQGRSKQQKANRELAYTPLPVFPKTSNPELDDLLSTIHREQFTIDHLPNKFRRIVVKTSKHHLLTDVQQGEEVVERTVNVDSQVVPLTPVTHRKYHSGRDLTHAVTLCRSPSDYNVLIPLVEAMAFSKVEVKEEQWRAMVRKCGLAGRPAVAMAIATNGFDLLRNRFPRSKAVARELVRSLITRNLLPLSDRSIKKADSVKALLKREWERIKLPQVSDRWMIKDPVIDGVVLFIRANDISRNDGKLEKKLVTDAVDVLKRSSDVIGWETHIYRQALTSDTPPASASSLIDVKLPKYIIAREALADYEPVLAALQKSQSFVEAAEHKKFVVEQISKLQTEVDRWKTFAAQGGSEYAGMGIHVQAAEKLKRLLEDEQVKQLLLVDKQPPPNFYHNDYLSTKIVAETPAEAAVEVSA